VGLVELDAPAQTIIDNVLWWTRILKTARATASEWLARSEPRGDADRRRGEQSAVKAEVDASEKSIQMVVSDTRAASAAGVSFGSRAEDSATVEYRSFTLTCGRSVPNDTVSTAARRKLFRARRTRPSKVAARRCVRTSPGSSRDVVDAGTVPRSADAALR
jgi:hypothetical protein